MDQDTKGSPAEEPAPSDEAPSPSSVRDYLLYGLSLPERAIRGTAGVVGGTLRESAAFLVPQSFRNAKTYQVFIGQMLDFMAEDMAGVDPEHRPSPPRVDNFVARKRPKSGSALRDRYAPEPSPAQPRRPNTQQSPQGAARPSSFVARKAVGNFVDLATLATFHVSPMLLLALVGDIAYGSKAYLKELAEDLEARGVIDDAGAVQQADDLLDAVASASQKTAQSFDTPPLSVDGLKETIRQTRESVAEIDPAVVLPKEDLDRLWERIRSTANGEGVSPLAISGLMTLGTLEKIGKIGTGTLSTVRVAGSLVNRHVLDHYREALGEINRDGFYRTLSTSSRPYVDALWRNFSSERGTLTEEFIKSGGVGRTWRRVQGWVKGSE